MVKKQKQSPELDGVFVLKLVMYVILGSLWLKLQGSENGLRFPLPVGLLLGLVFASHEHFQIDRKLEYLALILAGLVGLIAPYGLFINL